MVIRVDVERQVLDLCQRIQVAADRCVRASEQAMETAKELDDRLLAIAEKVWE